MNKLNACTMTLTGRTLIEASAGTGKTYTIASLYLRYIVEQPLASPLTTDQILVVTFTRAATAELRERIRQRLHGAVACFRGQDPGEDRVVQDLLARFGHEREQVLKRLYAAEKTMDEAAIYTIHGFCHRAITRHAFATGGAGFELHENDDALLLLAVEDFWRQLLYPLRGNDYLAVLQAMRSGKRGAQPVSPQQLMRQLKGLLSLKSVQVHPKPLALATEQFVPALMAKRMRAWQDFSEHWQSNLESIHAELAEIPRISAKSLANHMLVIGDWLSLPSPESPAKTSWDYLNKQLNEKAELAKIGLKQTQSFMEAWLVFEQEQGLRSAILSQALFVIKQRLGAEKEKRHSLSPDDLMERLHHALQAPEQGEVLAELLARQYPVALIDEFQDTDPLQYGIFERIYQHASDFAWLMIGDPKQSIYAFRGGDIHTYAMARQRTDASRHLSLSINYRSSQAMVEAVNQLFGYCAHSAFKSDTIRYEQVTAKDEGEKGGLIHQGHPEPALTFWQFEKEHTMGAMAAQQCAEHIAQLLNAAQQGQAHLGGKPLQPSDLAILVHDRFEAEQVADALRARSVRSVFLSRDSVFATPIAQQLLQVVEAFHEPKNERLLMAALANGLVPFTAQELAELRQDELQWQQHQTRFQRYGEKWQSHGILPAIHGWLFDYQLPAALMSDELTGERRLADLMHAAELLQIEAMGLDGPFSVLRQFRQFIQEPDHQSKSQQRRLESDKDLVQIVTIHASKGLEYPIVFIPYGLAGRAVQQAIYPMNGQQVIDFSNSSPALQKADSERLAEEIRLLYVAITRAVYVCYIGLAQLNKLAGDSALGYLLNQADGDAEKVANAAFALSQNNPALIQTKPCSAHLTRLEVTTSSATLPYHAKAFIGQIDRSWRLSSYSALSAQSHGALTDIVPGMNDEQCLATEPTPRLIESPSLVWQDDVRPDRFSFQKGPQAGNALHLILELQPFADGDKALLTELTCQSLRRSGILEEPVWTPIVSDWLADVLATPLRADGVSLNQLAPAQALVEMEFFLSIRQPFSPSGWNALMAKYPLFNAPVQPLNFEIFHGLLKGFVDLIFEWKGQYYVCDYKSNHLGDSLAVYDALAMDKAMADHRYDAQLILYTVALHRFLKQKLPHYDYDTHVGGGLYLFLRGMSACNQGQTGVAFYKPKRQLIEQLDALLGE